MRVIVSLKDTAARVFGIPFVVQAAAQAVRSLRDEVNSKESTSDVARHPDDFELYEIALFDEDSGAVSVIEPIRMIARAKDLRDPS
ncbi:MAG: nonstructural protein [Microvirus sp.]|nr:MAG: nonstructural protein [Microvirus sp.]